MSLIAPWKVLLALLYMVILTHHRTIQHSRILTSRHNLPVFVDLKGSSLVAHEIGWSLKHLHLNFRLRMSPQELIAFLASQWRLPFAIDVILFVHAA